VPEALAMSEPRNAGARAVALLVVAMVSVQGGASIAKQLFATLGPAGTVALRVAFAALMLVVVERPWRHRLDVKALRVIVAYGAALGTMNLTFYLALARIPLGLAVAIEFAGPLAVAVLASRRPLDALWVMLAVVGIVSLLPLGAVDAGAALDPVGVAMALAAAACWAIYIVIGRRAGTVAPSGAATAIGMVVAALVALPVGIAQAGGALLNLSVWPFALGVALLSSAIPYSLEMRALKVLPAKTFGILMSLEPAMAAIFGLTVLGERLTPMQWGAIGCVMAASAGSTWAQGREALSSRTTRSSRARPRRPASSDAPP
jgi:inner membrane transporter RhtA